MLIEILNKLIGDVTSKTLKRVTPLVEKINRFEEEYQKTLTLDEDFPKKTAEFKERLKKGETLDDILPEAFALVKNACRRNLGRSWEVRGNMEIWNMVPFDVQLIGGIVLHEGNIAEMKTGEGKTLVCTMPAYLNALTEKGVFVVTVNEYLAQRDAEWMGGIYKYLGLTVGINLHEKNPEEKKEAYLCDIIYGTNNEFGFDYLRDNMAVNINNCVQRNLHYAIIDEVDSILIDEARTPLIISAPAEESTSKYKRYAELVAHLKENQDYNIDEKLKTASLSEEGIAKLEKMLNVENIFTDSGYEEVHHLEQALKAMAVFKKDIDYVVKDDEVIIVDEFTGRLMPGRRYSDGLHQAIEAKERVEIKRESRTLATITFQNYFRLFDKIAGMTGTAATEAEEFYKIYGLDTVVIPTNKPMIRQDLSDSIYKNERGKFKAVIKKVKELYQKGQPVLIGTISIERSEILSQLLKLEGVPHTVLNAKHHEREAEIIAKAGAKNAVTIATNMAGRGTDIKINDEVKQLGGLHIIGTERHESRRIDNQLRGRSGRQGDPGMSQFYVSMEDELMRLFGAERIKRMMEILKVPEDMPIENGIISKSIESAQKKVEGHNFDIRKHIVEYDDVMNKHRDIIYSRRKKILNSENIKNDILILIEKQAENIVLKHTGDKKDDFDYKEILETVNNLHVNPTSPITIEELSEVNDSEELIEKIKLYFFNEYNHKETMLPDPEIMRQLERNIYLRIIDTLWMEHIDNISQLREAVALRGYAQRDPLLEYKEQAYLMFKELIENIENNTVNTLFKLKVAENTQSQTYAEKPKEDLRLNQDEIKEVSTGSRELIADQNTSSRKISNSPIKILKKAGRNDLCPCGSGKKYKKCCGS